MKDIPFKSDCFNRVYTMVCRLFQNSYGMAWIKIDSMFIKIDSIFIIIDLMFIKIDSMLLKLLYFRFNVICDL